MIDNHLKPTTTGIDTPQSPAPTQQMSEFLIQETSQPDERRVRNRIDVCIPAKVRGADATGKPFVEDEQSALLDNLSSTGVLVHIRHNVELGQRLLIVFSLTAIAAMGAPGATMPDSEMPDPQAQTHVAVTGIVRRLQPNAGTTCGVGVEILRHRFLYGGDAALQTT